MTPHPPRFALRRAAIGACAALALATPADAVAAKAKHRPAKLSVASLSSPPKSVRAGSGFTVRGRIANRGGTAAPAMITLSLRAGSKPVVVYALDGGHLRSVKPGRSVAFTIRVRPTTVARARREGFLLRACVRTRRGAKASCRTAARRVVMPQTPAPKLPAPADPGAPAKPPASAGAPAPAPDTTVYTSGARTLDDALFPTIGNGGYDARHYDLDLAYTVSSKLLTGTATMTAVATQDLSDFSMDLTAWNGVTQVLVDDVPASAGRDDEDAKLIVTPATGIKAGSTFRVAVSYGGIQQPYIDPDGSPEGLIPSTTYGAVAVDQPVGAMGWYPNNNVPHDKATYRIRMTVPSPFSVVAGGVLTARTDDAAAGRSTFTWEDTAPASTYLVGLGIGVYDLSSPDPAHPAMTTPRPGSPNASVPFYTAVDASFTTGKPSILAQLNATPAMLDFFSELYATPYPYTSMGGIVPRQNAGYALEVLSRPIYAESSSATFAGPGLSTVAHESSHQLFGDYVTLRQQRDMWLNEGFTTFNEWLWGERENADATVQEQYDDRFDSADPERWTGDCADSGFWNCPTAAPTAVSLFGPAVYDRGAMTVFGIFEILGEPAYRTLFHDYLAAYAFGNASTEDLIAFVKAHDPVPGRGARWDEYFRQWLYATYASPDKPAMTYANFDTYALP